MVIRVLELFSGIGGMHCALKRAGADAEVVAAIDINLVANSIYQHNFEETPHFERNICGLTADQVNTYGAEMLVMSPPCQPFTRQGLMNDIEDNRTQPLLHILTLIPHMESLRYVLLENVKGFETSVMRDKLLSTLETCAFVFQEFLICPRQVGVPNSRLRYYLIAKRKEAFGFETSDNLREDLINLPVQNKFKPRKCGILESYLEELTREEESQFLINDRLLLKYAEVMDVIDKNSDKSCCFTKAYGRFLKGTGSVLQQSGDLDSVYTRHRQTDDDIIRLQVLKELKLRFLTPREICRLLGFDEDFAFPESCTLAQKYRALGNSLNVVVVATLMQLLLMKPVT